jgi:hypothetical protein
MSSNPVLFGHSETANKHQVFGGPSMNGDGGFGGLSGTGKMPVLPKATSPNHVHQQRSEESTAIFAPPKRFAPPAGFFAALRMANGFEDTP